MRFSPRPDLRRSPTRRLLSPLCLLGTCVILAQLFIFRQTMGGAEPAAGPAPQSGAAEVVPPSLPATALQVPRGVRGRAQQQLPPRNASKVPTNANYFLEDPLPGVHMVYMYANGSDPAIAMKKPLFGGAAGGASPLVATRPVSRSRPPE